jgi:hypothetical protein
VNDTHSSADAPRPATASVLDPALTLACHAIRLVAVAWIAWAVYAVVSVWSDPARVARIYGQLLKLDLAGYSSTQHMASFAVLLVDIAISGLVVLLVWRLFGHFLAGRILDVAAVDEMRCLGWAGLAALLVDMAARPAVAAILSAHVESAGARFHVWGQPNDLLHIMMALFIVVVASVLRTGVAIADEHRQIV